MNSSRGKENKAKQSNKKLWNCCHRPLSSALLLDKLSSRNPNGFPLEKGWISKRNYCLCWFLLPCGSQTMGTTYGILICINNNEVSFRIFDLTKIIGDLAKVSHFFDPTLAIKVSIYCGKMWGDFLNACSPSLWSENKAKQAKKGTFDPHHICRKKAPAKK